MDLRRVVGLNVRRRRLAEALSQEELASRMGVEQFYVSGLEAGRRNPTLTMIGRAATALGVQPAKLFDEVGLDESPASSTKSTKAKTPVER
jgi:transcriptional regulator with XRE-family HTH domain